MGLLKRLRRIWKCLVPCIRQQERSCSPERSRNTRGTNTSENQTETKHRCRCNQYKSLIEAERLQDLLDVRNMMREESETSAQMGSIVPQLDYQGRICLGEYKFTARLGSGLFGQVMLAKKESTCGCSWNEKLFAVKVVPRSCVSQIEKDVLIRSVGHPFIVQLFSYYQTMSSFCYVMEFMDGGTLRSKLREMNRFPETAVRFYAAELILAVNFLHKRGIVHRDIKPSNILLAKDGHCKLADFGLSKDGMLQQKLTSGVCGTRPYMAPEVVDGHQYGCEADWWSVGLVMYEMMLGLYRHKVFIHPGGYPSYVTKDAESILRMLLTRNPEHRLGAYGDTRSILQHPFFQTVVWEEVLHKDVTPPVITKCPTTHPGAVDDDDQHQCSGIYKSVIEDSVPEEPSHPSQSESCPTKHPGASGDDDQHQGSIFKSVIE